MIELHIDIPADQRKQRKLNQDGKGLQEESSDGLANEEDSGNDDKAPGRTNERSSMLKLESLDQIKRRDLMHRQKEMLNQMNDRKDQAKDLIRTPRNLQSQHELRNGSMSNIPLNTQ